MCHRATAPPPPQLTPFRDVPVSLARGCGSWCAVHGLPTYASLGCPCCTITARGGLGGEWPLIGSQPCPPPPPPPPPPRSQHCGRQLEDAGCQARRRALQVQVCHLSKAISKLLGRGRRGRKCSRDNRRSVLLDRHPNRDDGRDPCEVRSRKALPPPSPNLPIFPPVEPLSRCAALHAAPCQHFTYCFDRCCRGATAATSRDRPMLGHGSTSDALSNKQNYPFCNRVVSPDRCTPPPPPPPPPHVYFILKPFLPDPPTHTRACMPSCVHHLFITPTNLKLQCQHALHLVCVACLHHQCLTPGTPICFYPPPPFYLRSQTKRRFSQK